MAEQDSVKSIPDFIRRPYTGSCHCGTIKYIAYLSLPASETNIDGPTFHKESGLGLYKCNCNVCHKMGIFHLRLASAPDDFVLLSPTNIGAEDSGVTSYQCNARKSDWYFCKTCGVRCITVFAKGEVAEVDVPVKSLQELGLSAESAKSGETVTRQVWKLKKDGFREGSDGNSYFSINAATLNPGQEGLDLRMLHEKRWIAYVDSLDRKESMAVGTPHRGGMY